MESTQVKLALMLLCTCALMLLSTTANAAQVTSNDLLTNPDLYNGKTITYEGEVVGDIIDGWINVKDDNAAIGIYVGSNKLIDEITYLGNYKTIGDIVQITGKFYKADPLHGGDLDIRAKKLEVVKIGTPIKHTIDKSKVTSLLMLFGITIFLYILKSIIYKKRS